jgi:hypothetical protein
MKTRCKPGDLAIIIRDEAGCEKNIGKVVEVSGPMRLSETKGPQWLIRSVSPSITWYIKKAAPSTEVRKSRGLRFSYLIDHPDAWMVPIIAKDGSARHLVADTRSPVTAGSLDSVPIAAESRTVPLGEET